MSATEFLPSPIRTFVALACAAAVTAVGAPPAEAQEFDVGVRGGTVWSYLTAPRDPRGAPTLMDGRSFSGLGSTGGLSTALRHRVAPNLSVGGELDLLYARQYASATESDSDTGARRTTTFGADILRLPLLATLQLGSPAGLWTVGGGPELWAPLQTGADVELTGVSRRARPIATTSQPHVLFDLFARYSFPFGGDWSIPLEVRVAWDPWVPPTTVGRFDGWRNRQLPGRFRVAYDWHLLLLTGLTWRPPW